MREVRRTASGAATGAVPVSVEQAFHQCANSVRLSGAGHRAEGLRPERQATLAADIKDRHDF